MSAYLTLIDFIAISPLLILLFGAMLVLLIESFAPLAAKRGSIYITLATLFIAIAAAIIAPFSENLLLTPWLTFDSLSRFFTLFFLLIGVGVTLVAYPFFQTFDVSRGEFFFLLLSSLFGLILIGASADFLTLFLGIETLSLSLYILCGYMKKWRISQESSIKYFLMGALAAGFLLYGIALIYGATGTTRLDLLSASYSNLSTPSEQILFLSGIALVTLGLAFEAAVVPFQVWAPDVYDGSPTPVTALMAVGTKVGAFAAFIRVFMLALPNFNNVWNEAVALISAVTLVYANIVALRQTQLRRFFAYSGISHAGFLLLPLAAQTSDSLSAILYYLVVYALATFGAFAVISILDKKTDGVILKDLNGLFHRSPFLAGVLTLCLLTLAGVPPTAGFFAKLYLFKVAFEAQYYGLVIVALLTTILSAFYYLRIVAAMFTKQTEEVRHPTKYWSAAFVGAFTVAVIIALSFYPTPYA